MVQLYLGAHFDCVGKQRGGGVEGHGYPVEGRPGGVTLSVLDSCQLLSAKVGLGGDLLDRQAAFSAQLLYGPSDLGAVESAKTSLAHRSLWPLV
jgi:hypothetical protein